MRTRLVLAVAPLALVAAATLPSSAAPKAMSGSYTASAPVPGAPDCDGTAPGSVHTAPIKVPGAGRFTAELTGFAGDWDFYLEQNGGMLSSSTGSFDATTETVSAKIKKAGTVDILSCNWAGGPTGAVKWTFVPNK
jgi:hypothetical protein